ncbi:lysin A, glycosyl hydrolase domain [Gordonia phage BiPauneto]|nr:lysin A, glycosyl hydrolase domain [Gordonia phage BiPauneto]
MDGEILRRALSPTTKTAGQMEPFVAPVVSAMEIAGITTVRRAAAWFATLGEETGGFANFVEIWGPTAQQRGYEGRLDLGNTVAGDGYRFRGRGAIQTTGRNNYRELGKWCKARGLVDDPEHFVKNPDLVATPRWAFVSAAMYWSSTSRRGKTINEWADAGDILAVSRCVNGWIDGAYPWGWPNRQSRWNNCLALGEELLPGGIDSMNDADKTAVVGAAIQMGQAHVSDAKKGVIGPRPQRHTEFYNVDGNPSFAAKGQKLAYVRAMLMDLWNELVFDGYKGEVEDPNLDGGQYGSPVRFIIATHKNARQTFLLVKAIAEKNGIDVEKVLEPAPSTKELK